MCYGEYGDLVCLENTCASDVDVVEGNNLEIWHQLIMVLIREEFSI